MPRIRGRLLAVVAVVALGAACAAPPPPSPPPSPPATNSRLAPIDCAEPVQPDAASATAIATAGSTTGGSPAALEGHELSGALDAALRDAEAPDGSGSVTVVSWRDGSPMVDSVPTAAAEAAVEEAATDATVVSVDASITYTAFEASALATDPDFGQQWAFQALPFESTWSCGTGRGVRVAVIDTGVQGSHPDLAGRVTTGYRKLSGGAGAVGGGNVDPHGHGTHVAGIVAANANNGIGVAGVAPEVTIIPVRVLNSAGAGWDADIADGIIWAVDNGAHIVNLSLGGAFDSPAVRAAVDHATAKGVTVIAAAGNDGAGGRASYPAALPDVIAVASIDQTKRLSYFSTRGSYVDVAAPGSRILSTCIGNTYCDKSGTSMAAPHVAAVAALVRSANPGVTPAQVRSRLIDTADDAGPRGFDAGYGHGIIDPVGAVTGRG